MKHILDQHLAQNQGAISKDFAFEITFAPENKITGTKLKKPMDDFNDYARGTTKKIKSSDFVRDEEDLKGVDGDPDEPRYKYGTKLYKVFNNVEYKGAVVSHDPTTKLYRILYDDEDTEEMYHNEVKLQHHSTVKRLPKKRRYKKRREIATTNFIKK